MTQYWEEPLPCKDCQRLEEEVSKLESKLALLEDANFELRSEIKRLEHEVTQEGRG